MFTLLNPDLLILALNLHIQVGKLENRGRSFVEAPSPPGWKPSTGVDTSYSFAQDCKEQVAALQRLKASKGMFSTTTPTPQQQQRRMVLVLGVGATTALGDMSNVACLRNLLPAAISSLALRYHFTHLFHESDFNF